MCLRFEHTGQLGSGANITGWSIPGCYSVRFISKNIQSIKQRHHFCYCCIENNHTTANLVVLFDQISLIYRLDRHFQPKLV